jgi:hypothetical protein
LRLTMVHSYSKKMLESGNNQITKKSISGGHGVWRPLLVCLPPAPERILVTVKKDPAV